MNRTVLAPRSRAARLLALGSAVALAVTACTQIPQSSAVRSSEPLDGNAASSDAPQFRPPGPSDGTDGKTLIRGFMQAGTGPQNDYSVAREYLGGDAVREWDPGRRTVVYAAEPTITAAGDDDGYRVQVEVESEIDEYGQRTMAPAGTTQAWDVTLDEGEDGLRITSVPDGVLLSQTQFTQLYAPHELMFYDQTEMYAVPDVRWFVNRGSAVTAVTRALLHGPSPYLAGAVTTAFPLSSGADLSGQSVPVTNAVAQVDLTEATVDGADRDRLFRMREQLETTLEKLAAVDDIEVTVAGRPLGVGSEDDRPDPVRLDPAPGSVQVGVDPSSSTLVLFQGLTSTSVGGLTDLRRLSPVDPAMSHDRTRFAFLDAARAALYVAGTDGSLESAVHGAALTAPSLDVLGWAWTVDRGAESRINAVPTGSDGGDARVVTAPWLGDGESIVALRISHGGARAALIVDDGERRTLRVAGVVRGSDGVPTALTEPILLPTVSEPSDIAWVGGTSVVASPVAADETVPVRPEIVAIDGTSRQLNPLTGLRGISSGDPGELYAETDTDVSVLVGSSWRAQEVEDAPRDLAFPG